jgi:hypothetical protein
MYRSGTVTAMRKTKLLALDSQDFHALIGRLHRCRRPSSRRRARQRTPPPG